MLTDNAHTSLEQWFVQSSHSHRSHTTGSRFSRLVALPQSLQRGQPVWRLHAELLHHFAEKTRQIQASVSQSLPFHSVAAEIFKDVILFSFYKISNQAARGSFLSVLLVSRRYSSQQSGSRCTAEYSNNVSETN